MSGVFSTFRVAFDRGDIYAIKSLAHLLLKIVEEARIIPHHSPLLDSLRVNCFVTFLVALSQLKE